MRVKTLQILWHDKQPVFSVDFSPCHPGVLATAGADKEVKVWRLAEDDKGDPAVEYVTTLSNHTKTVNVVRFGPSGDAIASAGDSGEVVLWRAHKPHAPDPASKADGDGKTSAPSHAATSAAPSWKAAASLRGQMDDVQDLAWSPDGSAVVTGSVENVAVVWDAQKHRALRRLDGHHHYVQGVAWDPLGDFVTTQSGDRSCRVYAPAPPPPAAQRRALAAAAKREEAKEAPKTPNQSNGAPMRGSAIDAAAGDASAARAPHPPAVQLSVRDRIKCGGLALEHVLAKAPLTHTARTPVAHTHPAQGGGRGEGAEGGATIGAAHACASPLAPNAPLGGSSGGGEKDAPGGEKDVGGKAREEGPPPKRAKIPKTFLFHDETMPSFFRRLDWSPDGSFLACPAGQYARPSDGKPGHCVHIYARGQWQAPALTLPVLTKAVVAVRFNPVLFKHRQSKGNETEGEGREGEERERGRARGGREREGEGSAAQGSLGSPNLVFDLPYRVVFAIATLDTVAVYDTGSPSLAPVCLASGLHFAALTDIAWAPDGRTLAVSSHDGYCSLFTFNQGELGTPIEDACAQSERKRGGECVEHAPHTTGPPFTEHGTRLGALGDTTPCIGVHKGVALRTTSPPTTPIEGGRKEREGGGATRFMGGTQGKGKGEGEGDAVIVDEERTRRVAEARARGAQEESAAGAGAPKRRITPQQMRPL